MQPLHSIPTAEDIRATHRIIQDYIHETPVMTCAGLDELTGAQLFFKCENFQKIGAFKMRGAASAALRIPEAARGLGIATHSSGNHGQAIARAAQMLGVPAYIVMPHDAPAVKIAAIRAYGAKITFCNNTPQERQDALEQVVANTGAFFIHPFDDYAVVTGQATAAVEFFQQVKQPLDYLLGPIGGGGLISGCALSAHYFSPETTVIGAEPHAVDDAYRSMQSGKVETNPTNITIADGLRTHISEKTFGIMQLHLSEVLLVEEEAIIEAMRLIWERMKIIIEPSAAVPFAAVRTYPDKFVGQKVGIILTGGNVDVAKLPFGGVRGEERGASV